jgi:hypothetical protein
MFPRFDCRVGAGWIASNLHIGGGARYTAWGAALQERAKASYSKDAAYPRHVNKI